jgi:hypothetical protein
MIAIALIAGVLGGASYALRLWRLASRYAGQAEAHRVQADDYDVEAAGVEGEFEALETACGEALKLPVGAPYAAQIRALQEEADRLHRRARWHRRIGQALTRASRRPWLPLEPAAIGPVPVEDASVRDQPAGWL